MNYTQIQDQIRSILKRGTSLDSDIPTWITLAESQIKADVRYSQSLSDVSLTLTAGQSTATYPAGLELRDLSIDFGTYRTPISIVSSLPTPDTTTGQPRFATVYGDTLLFDVVADQNYTITAQMYGEPDIATTTTNWIGDAAPDAYIYGALMHSTVKTEADPTMYSAMFDAAISKLKRINAKRNGYTAQVMRVDLAPTSAYNINRG